MDIQTFDSVVLTEPCSVKMIQVPLLLERHLEPLQCELLLEGVAGAVGAAEGAAEQTPTILYSKLGGVFIRHNKMRLIECLLRCPLIQLRGE